MKPLLKLLALFAVLAVDACGGGSSPPPAPIPPTSGIGRTGVAVGTISTFGSVVVNGVHYDTSTATFSVDDSPGSESDLSVGDVVVVNGTIDDNLTTGTADTVSFDDSVQGPVDSFGPAPGQLGVLGQSVITGADTSFDDNIPTASLAGLSVGDIVEVGGFFASDGTISATRIELKPAGSPFEVHGTVNGLDTNAMTCSLNALVVDYSSATLDNFPGGTINDGDLVEAKGNALSSAGELIAGSVELEILNVTGDPNSHVEIEGLITRFVSAQDFDVTGVPVTTNGATIFTGGVAGDLALNVKVEVEGSPNAGGILVAEKVDIRRAKIIRATALVDSVDAAANSLVMLGITFNVDALTRFEDKSSARIDPLGIGDLNTGDYLSVRGAELPAGSGQILVGILERDDPRPDTILQGFVSSVSDPALDILGVTIETSASTQFRDTDGTPLTATEFFMRVQQNSLVKAKGTESSTTTITASEVSFELQI